MAHILTEVTRRLWNQSPTLREISKVSLGDVFSKALGLGSALVLIRGLTVADYASFVAFNSIAYLSSGLVGTGINRALVRFSAEYLSRTRRRPHSLYLAAPVAQVCIFVAVIAVSLCVPTHTASVLLGDASLAGPVQLGLLYGLGLLLVESGRAIYQAEERFTLYVGALWVKQALVCGLVLCLWATERLSFGRTAFAIAGAGIVVGIAVLALALGTKVFVGGPKLARPDMTLAQEFGSASAWLMFYYITLAALGQIDVLILSRFASTEQFSVYGVARQYYMMALLLLGSIQAVLLPKFSRVEMQDPRRQQAFLRRWLQLTVWLGVPILAFDLGAKPFFVWVNGARYEQSFSVFVVFSVGIWLSLMLSPLVQIILSRRQFGFLFSLGLLALGTALACNWLLVPVWGALGAAVGAILPHLVINGISFARICVSTEAAQRLLHLPAAGRTE